jgi:hypothetical protein
MPVAGEGLEDVITGTAPRAVLTAGYTSVSITSAGDCPPNWASCVSEGPNSSPSLGRRYCLGEAALAEAPLIQLRTCTQPVWAKGSPFRSPQGPSMRRLSTRLRVSLFPRPGQTTSRMKSLLFCSRVPGSLRT